MTKTKTAKALLASVLALVLCVSMLVGTTFAWFTDSVTSAGNIIKSGTLDVEMQWEDGTKAVPADDSDDWKDASKGAIFDYKLWEPGYTEVRHIQIANKGTLALKYQLNILANGEVSDLANVIDVYYVDPAAQVADRTALQDSWKIGTLTEVLAQVSTSAAGELLAGETCTITLALKMQETAGNEYQNKEIGSDFSVQLLATQLDFEPDSYGPDYDAGLEPEEEDGMSRTLADGSIVFYYNEESGFEGRVRLVGLPENIGSEYVVPAEVNDLGGKLAGIALDKLTVPAGITYGYKSLEGAAIKEVVLEDGAVTVPNRLFYKTNVESVVIPDSVTYLEESAFQQVYMKELVVPASVETFGIHVFAGSTLEKITFEGKNLVFDNRPMRECANLRTVVFNCDDITFNNSTSNADCWISNKGSNGNGYSNIAFYVKNETVEGKVRAAIIHENPETTPIYVNGKLNVNVETAEKLSESLAAGNNVVLNSNVQPSATLNMNGGSFDGKGNTVTATAAVGTGNATINPTGGTIKNLVVKGTGNTRSPYGIGSIQFSNTTLTEDLRIENVDVSGTRMALDVNANGNSVYVKDCELANMVQVVNQKEAVFENCHFYCDGTTPTSLANGTNNIILMGDMTFIGCHFEENINLYVDDSTSGTIKFIDCTYGNNGVEDRPFEPTVGFFTWWLEPQGVVNYPGSFGEGDHGRTHYTCIVDDTVVWEATN